jgi:uncharacterized membrane protein YgcG
MVLDVIETHAKHAHRAAHHHLKKLVPGASGGMVIVCVALAIITCVAGVFWAYPNLMAPTKVRKVNVKEPPEHPLVKVAMGFSPGAIAGIFLLTLIGVGVLGLQVNTAVNAASNVSDGNSCAVGQQPVAGGNGKSGTGGNGKGGAGGNGKGGTGGKSGAGGGESVIMQHITPDGAYGKDFGKIEDV